MFTRNHAPNRVVLGIIAKDGVLAQCASGRLSKLRSTPFSVYAALTETQVNFGGMRS